MRIQRHGVLVIGYTGAIKRFRIFAVRKKKKRERGPWSLKKRKNRHAAGNGAQ